MRRIISSLLAATALALVLPRASAITLYGTAYSGGGPATLYTIDSTTGIGTPVGVTGFSRVGAIDFDPVNGVLYGIGTSAAGAIQLITIDTTTGLATAVGNTGITANTFQDISFRSDGTLFGYSGASGGSPGQIYTINLTTGAATALSGTTNPFNSGDALAFNPSGALYNINLADIDLINQTNGTATTVGTVNYPSTLSGPRTNAMDYDLTSGLLYASVVSGFSVPGPGRPPLENFLANIDLATGDVTNVQTTVPGLDGLAVPLPPSGNGVPEAMSTLWLALPLAGLFAVRRYRLLD